MITTCLTPNLFPPQWEVIPHRENGCNDSSFDWQRWTVNVFPVCILMASHTVETTVPSLSSCVHLLLTSPEVKKHVPLLLHVDFRVSEMQTNRKRWVQCVKGGN